MKNIIGRYTLIKGLKTYYETNYETYNPGTATVVCIHTAGRETRQYHGIMEILAGKYQLVALDMPGHGKSMPVKGNKCLDTREEFGAFIWEFIETLGIKQPVTMGCSLGGNIQWELAQNYPVKAVISMQGADYTPTISPLSMALYNHPHVSLQHAHLGFSKSLIGRDTDQAAIDFIQWGVMTECNQAKIGDWAIYGTFDVRDKMNKVTCPVLIIRGEDDWIVSQELVEETKARLVNAKKVVYKPLPGIGHFAAVENPKAVSQIVDEFLSGL
ncbi:MAG: alpha/beta hydrolase [Desulfosporosinus sp.]|nr:alpha/beta hydrolase [Desulfosporosinus sp.]